MSGATTATTLAYAALAASVASAAVGAYGAISQGQAQKQAANYQAQVAKNNAFIAEKQAEDAEARGQEAERQQRVKVNQVLGAQRAALAGQGTDLNSGSPLDITSDAAATGTLDALTVRNNYERDALGFRTQGAGYQAQAGLLQMQGQNAMTAGYIGAASSLLSGASSVGDKWTTFKKNGFIN